jgi:hypothetical protein
MRFAAAPPTPPSTRPPTPLPTFAPTLLGGTARERSCICAPFESVRTRTRRVRMRLRVSAVLCVCARCAMILTRSCVCAWVCASRLCGPSRGTVGTCGSNSSAGGARRPRVCVRVIGSSPALATGASWASRTMTAPWAARQGHSTVTDAVSGAIYVIGGTDRGGTVFKDVLVSTDGGADRT